MEATEQQSLQPTSNGNSGGQAHAAQLLKCYLFIGLDFRFPECVSEYFHHVAIHSRLPTFYFFFNKVRTARKTDDSVAH